MEDSTVQRWSDQWFHQNWSSVGPNESVSINLDDSYAMMSLDDKKPSSLGEIVELPENQDERSFESCLRPMRRKKKPSSPSPECSTLSNAQEREMRRISERMMDQALQSVSLNLFRGLEAPLVAMNPQEWKACVRKPSVVLYRKKEEAIDTGAAHFVACAFLPGLSLEDIEYGMYADNTADECLVRTCLHEDLFLDAAVLQVMERRSKEDPFQFFGVKWIMCASPLERMVSPRDYAFFEHSKTLNVRSSERGEQRVLVQVMSGVGLHVVPLVPGVVRGNVSCTFMYHYDPVHHGVRIEVLGHLDPSGNVAQWFIRTCLSYMATSITRMACVPDIKYIMHHRLLWTKASASSIVSSNMSGKKKQKSCSMCLKSFRLLKRPRRQCGICHDIICTACCARLVIYQSSEEDCKPTETHHMCHRCGDLIQRLRRLHCGQVRPDSDADNGVSRSVDETQVESSKREDDAMELVRASRKGGSIHVSDFDELLSFCNTRSSSFSFDDEGIDQSESGHHPSISNDPDFETRQAQMEESIAVQQALLALLREQCILNRKRYEPPRWTYHEFSPTAIEPQYPMIGSSAPTASSLPV